MNEDRYWFKMLISEEKCWYLVLCIIITIYHSMMQYRNKEVKE